MAPKTILLMRHAEKPDEPGDIHLSPAGQARAKKLATFIPQTFGALQFLFASAPSAESIRPIETITPLAQVIHLPIDQAIADKDYPALAAKLLGHAKYDGRDVLICWHHGEIPGLAQVLGAQPGSCPDPWDPQVFNLILKFKYQAGALDAVEQVREPF